MDRAPEALAQGKGGALPAPLDSSYVVEEEPKGWQRSLFGEILDWMLAPVLILWPLSMALEYYVSVSIANAAYDREIGARATVIASQLVTRNGRIDASVPAAAAVLLHGDAEGTAFSVRGPDNELLAGDDELPIIEFTPEIEPNRLYFTEHESLGMRVAYLFAQVPGVASAALVQVAETEEKRKRLASEIIGRVLASQFIIVPVAVILVWFGLTKGLRPLNDMRAKIRRRRPHDLSPIDAKDAPQELQPFVESFNDLMSRLDSSIRAQRRFVADAAHQMRTPLAGLKTQAELMLRQEKRADIEHAVRQISASVDRATHMVNQLLALARAETDAPVLLQPVDAAAIVREATSELVYAAMEKRIDLGYDGPEAGVVIEGNPYLLRELVTNLVDNALRYTPSEGQVTVRLASEPDAVRVEIEDTGIGIPPAERALVFERFFRGQNALEMTGPAQQGSGLGLAIVREIVQQHGGAVGIEDSRLASRAGALLPGTCIVVMLPRPSRQA